MLKIKEIVQILYSQLTSITGMSSQISYIDGISSAFVSPGVNNGGILCCA